MTPPPSPEAQLAFLAKLQRLFAEGDFTATYKYALLISLADLAVERGHDDGEPLKLPHTSIAAKFIELYWQQTAPYSHARGQDELAVLFQNSGAQAAVITALVAFRQHHDGVTLCSAVKLPEYPALLRRVAQTVAAQPINYLQNLGGQTDPFLFDRVREAVLLKPGAAYCLRRFQPLVQMLARSHWVEHVKRNRLNQPMLGKADDLESFLFETPRQTLVFIGENLKKLTHGQCFYCHRRTDSADVDHFVPFSLYPRDLMHNFVLAHPSCNRSKSDTLAARIHLERWMSFITDHDDELREIGYAAGRISDPKSCHAVARWGYTNAIASGAQAWLNSGTYETVGGEYLECFG